MRSSVRQVLSVIVLASVAVATFGCSHATLDSGTQALNMTYTPSPAGAGRYNRATFDVNKIHAIPVDPAAAEIFGSEALLFRFDVFTADLTLQNAFPFSNIALAAGTYNVRLIEFTPPSLVDTDPLPSNPPTCIEGVATLNRQSVTPEIVEKFDFVDPPSLTFTVSPGQTTLALTINVPGLITGYENSFTCQTGCGAGGTNCVTAFSEANFRAALLANVTLK